jgi:hypothetical protein
MTASRANVASDPTTAMAAPTNRPILLLIPQNWLE